MLSVRTGLWSALAVVVAAAVLVGCSSADPAAESTDEPTGGAAAASQEATEAVVREEPYLLQNVPELTMEVTSDAVDTRNRLNKYFTCEGADASPDLSWSGAPEETKGFVVLMEDPESDEIERTNPTLWTHWILYSIPPTVTSLSEALPATETLDSGAKHGINDYGNALYSGPCPEPTIMIPVQGCFGSGSGCGNAETIPAKVRAYHFYIYALDKEVDLAPGATRNQVLQEIEGHIIGAGELAPEFRSSIKKSQGGLSAPS